LQSLYREFDNLPQIVKNHVLVLKNDVGPTSTFWCSFLEMMETSLPKWYGKARRNSSSCISRIHVINRHVNIIEFTVISDYIA